MHKLLSLSIVFIALLISCKKDDINPDDLDAAIARDSLYFYMKQAYYWYNMPEALSVTASNKGNYKDPMELLEAMRYRALYRFSFVTDINDWKGFMEGSVEGNHGINIGLDQEGNARISMIFDKSPLYASGVRRGWIVKKINNIDVAPFFYENNFQGLDDLMGPYEAGITNIFLFKKPSGDEVTISSTKTAFTINTVLVCDTLHLKSGLTGHLVSIRFIDLAIEEFESAFAFFKSNNIKDLILDLRYNNGGELSCAASLASYIAGGANLGNVFCYTHFNNELLQFNNTYKFINNNYSLELPRLIIITSRLTASASELVINGLKPFINLITVGDTTYGKPVGGFELILRKKYAALPIIFKAINAKGESDYYDGFPPDKVLPDDITRDFNDREELCLKEAIHYLETGSISTKGEQLFKRYLIFSEKPEWLSNVFIVKK
jgi:C-terminal processing protease CtpA/Prc